ncbi:hypothetical protein E4H12_00850 [Candidatus Thorarchaeota archaeon]|nr:MAG: hypothetical protein E4H12_00850 [Candidatus Thorarchaeota archaeon]
MFSVKAVDGPHKGLVFGYSSHLLLKDATFVVSVTGRQRVLRNQRKNVHAGIIGTLCDILNPTERIPNILSQCRHSQWLDNVMLKVRHNVFYNPYLYETFVNQKEEALFEAQSVSFRPEGVTAWFTNQDRPLRT